VRIAVLGIRGIPASYSGFETCAQETTKYWRGKGEDVLVYCRKHWYTDKLTEYNGARLKYIGSIKTTSLDTLTHTLFSIINLIFTERKTRIVHLYNTGNAIFIPLLKLSGRRVILSMDGIEWKRDKWGKLAKAMYKLGERFAFRFADEIVADNLEVKNFYLEREKREIALIKYGAKLIDYDADLANQYLNKHNLKKREYFIFIGRLVPEKGVDELIKAYNQLNTVYPLVIIGDDANDTEYKKALFAQASPNLRFLGFVFNEEYEQLLANSLLYVSASKLEGTSPSLLAAMGAGVCAFVNGIPENLETMQGNGFHYRANDSTDCVKEWQTLIDNPSKILEMSKQGKEYVKTEYAWESIASQYLDLFNP
jgi:glycosyltransferase involved in cell wall biosynthesis